MGKQNADRARTMERLRTERAWAADAAAPREPPRKSWFMDDTPSLPLPADAAAAARWRGSRYDVAPEGGAGAGAGTGASDDWLTRVDERASWDPATHPEYARWLAAEAAAAEDNAAAEARMAAARDVTYDMEGRAFGVPVAVPRGKALRWYGDAALSAGVTDGVRTAPQAAQSFFYAVDAATGAPTSGDADGWAPSGKGAELDAFVARTTWGGGVGGGGGGGRGAVAAGMVNPATWEHRDAVVPEHVRHDPLDAELAASSAALAHALAREAAGGAAGGATGRRWPPPSSAPVSGAPTGGTHARAPPAAGSSMRVASSTVRMPRASGVSSPAAMYAASRERAAEAAASEAANEAAMAAYAAAPLPPALAAARRAAAAEATAEAAAEAAAATPERRRHSGAVGAAPRSDGMPATASALSLRNVPLRAVAPLVMSSVRGALHDAAHWQQLPCGDRVLDKLRFITMRDARGEYLLLALLLVAVLVSLVVGIAVACRRGARASVGYADAPYAGYAQYALPHAWPTYG